MNIGMTSLVQNNKLNVPQIARANLIAGTLISSQQKEFEQGSNDWIEILLESYVCQTDANFDFHAELRCFDDFVSQNLKGADSAQLKHSINEDIEFTLKAMEISPEPVISTLRAA